MKTIKIDNTQTGWTLIPGNTKTVVAYFNDGHKEVMPFLEFIVSKKRSSVVQIDCYKASEIIPKE